MNENIKIDLLNYDNFRKVFLNEKTRDWFFFTLLKPYFDITEEDLKNAEYIIDEKPEYIPSWDKPLINAYVTIDKNKKINIEVTTDRPQSVIKENSKTLKILEDNNFINIKFLKIVFDKYNIFETKRPILDFKLRDKYGNEYYDFWYRSIYLVLDNCKKIVDMEHFKQDIVENLKDLAKKYDFIDYYQYPKELEKEIEKAIEEDDKEKLKELFTKMKSDGATISMIATISDLDHEEVEEILNS